MKAIIKKIDLINMLCSSKGFGKEIFFINKLNVYELKDEKNVDSSRTILSLLYMFCFIIKLFK